MNVLWFLLLGAAFLLVASRTYGRHISNVFGVDDKRPTPAAKSGDNRDLVSTRADVVFAHHFASIAGTGPIVGPVFALVYGFFPIWVWVLVGAVFMGAVHDFGSLFVSIREGAKSIPTIARKTLGNAGYVLFILFFLAMIILVTSTFLNLAAKALPAVYPLADLHLTGDQSFLKTVTKTTGDGAVDMAVIGGIAATSLIVITALAIPLGWIQRRQVFKGLWLHAVGAGICILSIVIGFLLPVQFPGDGIKAWMVVLAVYTFFAAGLPVWLIVQPRDLVNVQILYGGMALLFAALLVGGFTGVHVVHPAASIGFGTETIGLIWPFLFITVACGAISGFHCMVAGGTTARQLSKESDARKVAYNGMLLESFLALLVTLTLASSITKGDYRAVVWDAGNPVLGFALAAGNLFSNALAIPIQIGVVLGLLTVAGFIVTTLDTAVRLNRYLLEELWDIVFAGNPPVFMKNYLFNAALSVGLMLLFAMGFGVKLGWLLFGAANQLVGALALIAVTAWLMSYGRKFVYTLVPAVFMLVTTTAALLMQVFGNYPTGLKKNMLYEGSAIFMSVLAIGVIIVAIRSLIRPPQTAVEQIPAGAGK
jgi:carbon starvation protein